MGPAATVEPLPNGATLIVSEQRGVPMVLVRVLLDAGSRRDPGGLAGLANLTADLLTEGTQSRSAAEISEAVDFVGASLGASVGTDHAQLSLRVLARDLDLGLDLLSDVLLRPAFDASEIARRREAVLASIRAARDNPTDVARKAFKRALFGAGPYGHPVEGTEDSVQRIAREDVAAFHARHYRPAGSAVVVVGDIDAAEARAKLSAVLASWVAGPVPDLQETPAPAGEGQRIEIDKPVTQASIVLGHRGVARDDPDYEAISVMNYLLGGGGFSSRLMESIRTEAGLAYSVGSSFVVNQRTGSFLVVMQTKNASVAEAIARARAEIERVRTEAVSEGELSDARRYLTGSFPLNLDSNGKIAGFLGQTWFYGLGLDYADVYVERINAVTAEDVLRVAQEHLHPDRLIEVVVADLGNVSGPESGEASTQK